MGEQLTIADVFELAADEIETNGGWVVLTLDWVCGQDLGEQAYEFLLNWLDVPSIRGWEDTHTKAEIVAKLRQAATAARGVGR